MSWAGAFLSSKLPLRVWRSGPHTNTSAIWLTQVHNQNGISISSAVFAGPTVVTNRKTDRPHYTTLPVTIGRMYLALQCSLIMPVHYDALIMTVTTARVHPVNLTNADQHTAAIYPQIKPSTLGCESACHLLLPRPPWPFIFITHHRSWYLVYRPNTCVVNRAWGRCILHGLSTVKGDWQMRLWSLSSHRSHLQSILHRRWRACHLSITVLLKTDAEGEIFLFWRSGILSLSPFIYLIPWIRLQSAQNPFIAVCFYQHLASNPLPLVYLCLNDYSAL